MKTLYSIGLLFICTFVNAQDLPLIFSYSAVPDDGFCKKNSPTEIHSIAYDKRGNYYYTYPKGGKGNFITAINNQGEFLWSDSAYYVSSEGKSFVLIDNWGGIYYGFT